MGGWLISEKVINRSFLLTGLKLGVKVVKNPLKPIQILSLREKVFNSSLNFINNETKEN